MLVVQMTRQIGKITLLDKKIVNTKDSIKFLNELRYKGKALIMTTHRGKSHNELGKKSIIIANVIQENKLLHKPI
jgi:hypothetical protein